MVEKAVEVGINILWKNAKEIMEYGYDYDILANKYSIKVAIQKSIDTALKEQAKQIFKEIEEILSKAGFYVEDGFTCEGYEREIVDEGLEKLKKKYVGGDFS